MSRTGGCGGTGRGRGTAYKTHGYEQQQRATIPNCVCLDQYGKIGRGQLPPLPRHQHHHVGTPYQLSSGGPGTSLEPGFITPRTHASEYQAEYETYQEYQ